MRTAVVLAIAFLAGGGTMSVELAAVRLIAPWYGTSAAVWTNVIGVILLALSLGYLLGGRLARGGEPLVRLGWMLLAAACFCAQLPSLVGPVAEYFLPSDLALGESAALFEWGSLATSMLLFLPPATALGTVVPLVVQSLQDMHAGRAGTAGGQVLAASTLGSLAGTFGTTHAAIPQLGLTGTFTLAALALAVSAWASFAVARKLRAPKLAMWIFALGLTGLAGAGVSWGPSERPALREGLALLAEAESPYQFVRVVEDTATDLRFLQVNEASDSFQSVWQREPGLLPEGFYYNLFALPVWWAQSDAGAARTWKTAILGLGAGTAVRVMGGALPAGCELETVGIELDPRVVKLAEAHMELERTEAHQVISGRDARRALGAIAPPKGRRFDQIVLDAYANQVEIPAHLSSAEFFGEVRDALVPDGWFSVNVGAFSGEDPVLRAVAETIAFAFGQPVLAVRVPAARNWVLFVRRSGGLVRPGDADWSRAEGLGRYVLAPLEIPSATRVFGVPVEALLTDDRNPIEKLQRQSIERSTERGA